MGKTFALIAFMGLGLVAQSPLGAHFDDLVGSNQMIFENGCNPQLNPNC